MRPVRYLSFALVGLAILAAPAGAASPFKDKNLEAAVQAALKLPKADFKDEDLAVKLSVLDVTGKGIKDLTGLDKCKGLLELKLPKNEITDVGPLKDLPLQNLDLASN